MVFEIIKDFILFQDFLHNPTTNVLANYRALKKLSSMVNSAMNKIVLIYSAEYLFYYSMNFDEMFEAVDRLWQIRNSLFFSFIFSTFFFAGDSCKNVEDSLSAWISWKSEHGAKKVPSSNVLLHEAKSHIFGLSGHIFILDYGAIFNVS